jgi:hypothetical protein
MADPSPREIDDLILSISMTRWLLLIAVATACKGGAKQGGEGAAVAVGSAMSAGSATAAGSATPVASDAALVQANDASLDDPRSQAARCASGCLYLLDVPLAEARQAFARDCNATWPYADDDCEGLLYARNCIYAGHGNVFKRPAWKQRFETQPWYRAKPAFKEGDFSPVALANVRALVAASKVCGEPVPSVTAEDVALATTWYDKLRAGEKVPGVEGDAFEAAYANHAIDERSAFAYVEWPDPVRREISISGLYHAVGPGEFDESARAVLVFDDKNQLIDAW